MICLISHNFPQHHHHCMTITTRQIKSNYICMFIIHRNNSLMMRTSFWMQFPGKRLDQHRWLITCSFWKESVRDLVLICGAVPCSKVFFLCSSLQYNPRWIMAFHNYLDEDVVREYVINTVFTWKMNRHRLRWHSKVLLRNVPQFIAYHSQTCGVCGNSSLVAHTANTTA